MINTVYKSIKICYNLSVYVILLFYRKEAGSVGLADKIGGLIPKDKFESAFRSALKKQNLSVASKESDNIFVITNGSASFRTNTEKARRLYEKNGSTREMHRLIKRIGLDLDMEKRMVSFTNGQEFLRLMLMREQDVTEDMISADFAEGLKKVVVYTPDDETIYNLDDETLKRWVVPREVAFSAADRNMCRILARAEIKEDMICGDITALELKISTPAFSSSVILCNDFRMAVHDKVGERFLVVAPSRESLLVLKTITNDILEGLGTVILNEYKKAKNPITTDVLMFTPEGVQTAGSFSVGRSE